MKNFGKIISLVLLLSLVVSVFAVLPAFAADDATFTPGITLRDWDAKGMGTATGGSDAPSLVKKELENGQPYWQLSANDKYVATGTTSGDYIEMSGVAGGVVVIQDGNGKTKNTDYLVMDFDMSTDSTLINGLYFHMRWMKWDTTNGKFAYDQGNNYPEFEGSNFDELIIETTNVKANVTPPSLNDNKWRNVTIIYDFTTIQTMCAYVYIDGEYCGTIQGLNSTASAYLQFVRIGIPKTGDYATATTNFANGSFVRFEKDYSGMMSEDGVLRNPEITLDMIPELAYTQENCPNETLAPVARVERGEETFPLYDINDIDGFDFKNGDKLVFLKNFAKEVVLPAGVEIAVVDAEGTDIASSTLVSVPTITVLDFAATEWIVRDRVGKITGKGPTTSKVYTRNNTNYTIDDNGIFNFVDGNYTTYTTLLSDTVTLGKSETLNIGRGTANINLNGHKLTIDPGYAHLFGMTTDGARINFYNGTVYHSGGGKNLLFANGAAGIITFDKTEVLVASGSVMIDQRVGTVWFKNSKVNPVGDLCSTKSYATRISRVIFENSTSDISNATSTLFYSGSVTASGVQQGSYTNRFIVKNSTINYKGASVFSIAAICAEENSEAQLLNFNQTYISIDNSTINSDHRLVDACVKDLTRDDEVAVETFTMDIDVDITNSDIACSSVVAAWNDYQLSSDVVPYTLTVDANVDGDSKINAYNALAWNRGRLIDKKPSALCDNININFAFAEGALLENAEIDRTGSGGSLKPANVTLGDGSTAAIAVNPVGGYIVTSEFDTYSYTDVKGETQTFAWATASGAALDINKVELPTATGEYDAYRWVEEDGSYKVELIPNFNVAANLTLHKDISLNIFVDRVINVDAVKFTVLGADNVKVTEYDNKTKIQVIGINPANIDTVYTIQVEVTGNGATVTKEIPISIESYCESILEKAEEGSKLANLMNAILAYGEAADAYVAGTLTDNENVSYGEAKTPEKTEAFENVTLNLNAGFIWEIQVAEGIESVIADYYYDGEHQEGAELLVKDGKVYVSLKAFDLDKDITLTAGDESITFNFAFYAEKAIASAGDNSANLAGMLDAIWTYATVAAAYKAN